MAVTCMKHGQNSFCGVAFAHGDDTDLRSRGDRGFAHAFDSIDYALEIARRIGGYGGSVGGHIMASQAERAKLARAAAALNAGHGLLPALILMTDEKRLPDPACAARTLPRNSALILRHTD